MRFLPIIAGAILGLLFVFSAVLVLFGFAPTPEFPENTPVWHFMSAFGPSGYMTFVKVMELTGGILVAIPRTRNLGLLVLGPIIVNIAAFHTFVLGGEGLFHPLFVAICLLALYLLWAERRAWRGLVIREE